MKNCSDNVKHVGNVICVNLNRFASVTSKKNVNNVIVDKQLNLQSFVHGDNRVFTLKAMVQHIGNERSGGHYVSVVKESGSYIKYDDKQEECCHRRRIYFCG